MRSRFCRRPPCGGSRPIGQFGESAGLQTHRAGVSKIAPRLGRYSSSAVMGLLLRKSRIGRAKLSCLLLEGSGPSRPTNECCRTAGCEGSDMPAQVAARLHEGVRSPCREYSEERCKKHRPRCLCRQRGCAQEVTTARQSSFSQLKLSENRRKLFFSSRTAKHVACGVVLNAFQQYEWLAGLATAK
jgi:hypothetical protein